MFYTYWFSVSSITFWKAGFIIILIKHSYSLLQVISSPYAINIEKFRQYTQDTAKHYVQYYAWYYMLASVHKLLIHGAEIVQYALLPIGQLSEEAQETRHKDFKRISCENTRKCSRLATNEDILYKLLLTSDPYISSMRMRSSTKKKSEFRPWSCRINIANMNNTTIPPLPYGLTERW